MSAIAIFVVACSGSASIPYEIPANRTADVFLIDVDGDAVGDVAVLDAFDLTVYPSANRQSARSLRLPDNARAMDVLTDPADGNTTVVAVCDDELRQFDFAAGNPGGQLLFKHHSYLSEGEQPYRFVLTFERQGESLFFLPSESEIELRSWTGEIRERIRPEIGRRTFEKVIGFPFWRSAYGRSTAIGFLARRSIDYDPTLIAGQVDQAPESERHNVLLEIGELDALESPPDRWPWFALRPDTENSPRVRCANRLKPGEAHVRIDTTLSDNGAIGPPRKYPGMITRLNAELPDFNGDGYTDLLLWNTDRPSVSVSSIARLTVQQDWPIRLTVHLFDPDKGRYTAKPYASLDVRATWEMLMRRGFRTPLAAWVVDDIDADGRTDLAFTVDATTYILWLMTEDGPEVEEFEVSEPIEGLSFAQPLDDSGRITIGLRTETRLYVIDPK